MTVTAPRVEAAATALARWCGELGWDAIPAAARGRTAELLLDLLGVSVRGASAPSSLAVRELVRAQGSGPATVLAATLRASAAWAALANGASAHAVEMDDVTTVSSLHPGAVVIPAALAVAEERRATAAATLAAIAAGYEVTIRVGNALGAASAYRRGFHPTSVAGVFGAAVAAGKLAGLDAAGLERAIGIAGTLASGSLEYLADGAWTKRLNPGWAAHAGIVAAGLAAAGFTAPRTALEGEHGLLRGYTDAPDPGQLTAGLSLDDLQIMRVSIKPYGCCRYAHGIIDAVLALRGDGRPDPDDVEEMRLGILSAGWSLVADPPERVREPRNVVDAQFSAPYAAAVALVRGRAGLAEFTDEAIADPRVRALARRATCVRDGALDAAFPRSWPAAVEIRMRGGRVLRARVDHALGEPENPVPRGALVDRFVEMVADSTAPAAARRLAARILALDAEPDLGVLQELA